MHIACLLIVMHTSEYTKLLSIIRMKWAFCNLYSLTSSTIAILANLKFIQTRTQRFTFKLLYLLFKVTLQSPPFMPWLKERKKEVDLSLSWLCAFWVRGVLVTCCLADNSSVGRFSFSR